MSRLGSIASGASPALRVFRAESGSQNASVNVNSSSSGSNAVSSPAVNSPPRSGVSPPTESRASQLANALDARLSTQLTHIRANLSVSPSAVGANAQKAYRGSASPGPGQKLDILA